MENPRALYVAGHQSGPTNLVRGSSRRITTMMASLARSTNIRVINRRKGRLDRCPVRLRRNRERKSAPEQGSRQCSEKAKMPT